MSSTERWLAAIDQLYDAVGRERQLAQALGEFRPYFGAQSTSFFTVADPTRPTASHTGALGLPGQLLLEYHAHYSEHDEWVRQALRRSDFATGRVYRAARDLMPLDDIRQTYFGRQFMARYDVVDALACVVETFASDGALSWTTYFRHEGQPPFDDGDAALLSQLAPHMRQVLRLHRRLAPQLAVGATLRDLLQQQETPVLFVDEVGRIADLNPAAEAALAVPSGWLAARAGELQVREAGRWQAVSTWLPSLRHDGGRSLTLELESAAGEPASLVVVPIQNALVDTMARYPAVAVCTLKPGPRDRLQALRARHALTMAEARVALRLADGLSVQGIAQELGTSVTTVRSQLAAVRAKLGVSRQAQVVSAVLAP